MAEIIDFTDSQVSLNISINLARNSNHYDDARRKAAEAKYNLDIILASKMPQFRTIRNNIGYESAMVMLLEESDLHKKQEIEGYYKEYIKQTARYKGLEKIIDALQSQISLIQSLIKNQKKELGDQL